MQTYKGEPNNIAWTKKDLEALGLAIEYGYVPLYTAPPPQQWTTNTQFRELTEIIEHLENARYTGASKAATLLKQQQTLIESLNAKITELTNEIYEIRLGDDL